MRRMLCALFATLNVAGTAGAENSEPALDWRLTGQPLRFSGIYNPAYSQFEFLQSNGRAPNASHSTSPYQLRAESDKVSVWWFVRALPEFRSNSDFTSTVSDGQMRHDLITDFGATKTFGIWTFSSNAQFIGEAYSLDDFNSLDMTQLEFSATAPLFGGDVIAKLGDVSADTGNVILGEAIKGKGLSFAFDSNTFQANAVMVSRQQQEWETINPSSFLADDHRMILSAGWINNGALFERSSQIGFYSWSDQLNGRHEQGRAFGLSFGLASKTSSLEYNADLAVSDWTRANTHRRGWALSHTLSHGWEFGEAALDFNLHHERATLGFHTPDSNLTPDFELFEGDLSLSWKDFDLNLLYETGRDNLKNDPNQLTLVSQSLDAALVWNIGGTDWTPEEVHLSFGGAKIRPGNGAAYMAHTGAAADELTAAREQYAGVGGTWSHGWGETDIDLVHTYFDERTPGFEAEDWRETDFSVSHSYHHDVWSLGGTFGWTRTHELDPSFDAISTGIFWSIEAAMALPDLPELSVSFTQDTAHTSIRAWGDRDRSVSETLELSANLTPWLEGIGWKNAPTATAFASAARRDGRTDTNAGFQINFEF